METAASGVRGNDRCDAVEGVEKKMRIELSAEELELHALGGGFRFCSEHAFLSGFLLGLQPEIQEAARHVDEPVKNRRISHSSRGVQESFPAGEVHQREVPPWPARRWPRRLREMRTAAVGSAKILPAAHQALIRQMHQAAEQQRKSLLEEREAQSA